MAAALAKPGSDASTWSRRRSSIGSRSLAGAPERGRRCRCASTPTSTRGPIRTSPPGLATRTSSEFPSTTCGSCTPGPPRIRRWTCAGIDCHIGSQLGSLEPYLDALDRLLALVDSLARDGIRLAHLNLGGGLGIRYRDESSAGTGGARRCGRRAAGRPGDRADAGAGPLHRRQRGRAAHAGRVPQAQRGEAVRGGRRGDERSDPPGPVRRMARHRAGHAARGRVGAVRDRRTGLRVRRLPRPRASARAGARRPARGALGRRVRVRDELELQLAPPRRGGHGGRRPLPRGAQARAGARTSSPASRCCRPTPPPPDAGRGRRRSRRVSACAHRRPVGTEAFPLHGLRRFEPGNPRS